MQTVHIKKEKDVEGRSKHITLVAAPTSEKGSFNSINQRQGLRAAATDSMTSVPLTPTETRVGQCRPLLAQAKKNSSPKPRAAPCTPVPAPTYRLCNADRTPLHVRPHVRVLDPHVARSLLHRALCASCSQTAGRRQSRRGRAPSRRRPDLAPLAAVRPTLVVNHTALPLLRRTRAR